MEAETGVRGNANVDEEEFYGVFCVSMTLRIYLYIPIVSLVADFSREDGSGVSYASRDASPERPTDGCDLGALCGISRPAHMGGALRPGLLTLRLDPTQIMAAWIPQKTSPTLARTRL